jgi:hypothetical protein
METEHALAIALNFEIYTPDREPFTRPGQARQSE